MTEGPEQEGQAIDQRLLGLSPQQAAELARSFYGDGKGPLDGPYVPVGSGTVLTASGRSPQQAEREGPVAPATTAAQPYEAQGHADGVADSRPAQPPSGPTGEPPDTQMFEVMRTEYRRILEAAVAEIRPPGYRPPQDQTRPEATSDPVVSVRRLLDMGPAVVKAAIPRTDDQRVMRARSIVLRALDDARLWFEEAERLQTQPVLPPRG